MRGGICKILIVDDKKSVGDVLYVMLELALQEAIGTGANIIVVESPGKAFEAINRSEELTPFDLVLLDIHCDADLPEKKSGYGIAAHAKKVLPECVVAMMTEQSVDELIFDECVAAGASDCIKKPFVMESLENLLKKHFGGN